MNEAPAKKLNPKQKRFLFILAGAVVLLSAFMAGKILWDDHQETATRERAVENARMREAERQVQLDEQQKAEQRRQIQQKEFDEQQAKAAKQKQAEQEKQATLDNQVNELQNKLKEIEGDKGAITNTQRSVANCEEQYPPSKYGDVCLASSVTNAQKELSRDIEDYNAMAKKMDPATLKSNSLPAALDSNGNPSS